MECHSNKTVGARSGLKNKNKCFTFFLHTIRLFYFFHSNFGIQTKPKYSRKDRLSWNMMAWFFIFVDILTAQQQYIIWQRLFSNEDTNTCTKKRLICRHTIRQSWRHIYINWYTQEDSNTCTKKRLICRHTISQSWRHIHIIDIHRKTHRYAEYHWEMEGLVLLDCIRWYNLTHTFL